MLQSKQYAAILKSGIAEVGAYRSLYPDVKAATFPIFQLRPWPNASILKHTIDKLTQATAGHSFGLELDFARLSHNSPLPAQAEFNNLFDPFSGYKAYFDLIKGISGAVPVLVPTRSMDDLIRQIANADRLNRGLLVHQRRGSETPLSNLLKSQSSMPHDTTILVDAEWSRDYLSLESWTLPAVERATRSLPEAEIVILSSSFPNSFSHIIGDHEEDGLERRLFNAVRQRFNSIDLTFGDWGSTRPPQSGGGGDIPSRIDIPQHGSWHIFRADPNKDLGFAEVAWIAQHHECFSQVPSCWGKEAITITNDEGEGITGNKTATQARINMHMTIQSGAASILPLDEMPYED